MAYVWRFFFVISALLVAVLFKQYLDLTATLPIPDIDYKEYWGPGDPKNYRESTEIKPFKISYGKDAIDALRAKLADIPKLATPLEGVAFQYGFNSDRLRQILEYWRSDYLDRWDERQQYLNQFPQFKTQIQGLDIHFIHVKPRGVKNPKQVVPLLMLHAWVLEFYEMIPILTSSSNDREYVFEVIVPSIPGYGFSQGSSKPGLSPSKMAVVMRNLMARLGFKKYYIHGADWGAAIGNMMVSFFQDEIMGFHSTMCMNVAPIGFVKNFIGSLAPSLFLDAKHIPYYYPLSARVKMLISETGYMHIQGTKPDTIGMTLIGNPVGLAGYVLEKFAIWTNPAYRNLPDGGLERHFTMDSLLDYIMVYYLSDCIITSHRLYAEAFSVEETSREFDRIASYVPTACIKMRYGLFQQPDWTLRDHFRNLIQSSHLEEAGHFVTMQLPDVVCKDIVRFVNRVYRKEV